MSRIGRIPKVAGRGWLLVVITIAVLLTTAATWAISSTPADAPGPNVAAGPATGGGSETGPSPRSELRIESPDQELTADRGFDTPGGTAATADSTKQTTVSTDQSSTTEPTTSASITVTSSAVTSSAVTSNAVTSSAAPTTVAPTTLGSTTSRPPQTPERFATLPPGSSLPSGASCANQIRPTAENVPENQPYNQTRGRSVTGKTYLSLNTAIARTDFEGRVDGDFVGSTDEIIQWGACKWGFDEDHIRAQVYAESGWFAGQWGDCGERAQPATGGTDGCSSVGLLQVRAAGLPAPEYPGLWPIAMDSSAMNIDFALAIKRLCFEGQESWLAQSADSGVRYRAGDEWGCVGRWFSGDWWDSGAKTYVDNVRALLRERKWETQYVGCPDWRNNEHCSNGGPRGF